MDCRPTAAKSKPISPERRSSLLLIQKDQRWLAAGWASWSTLDQLQLRLFTSRPCSVGRNVSSAGCSGKAECPSATQSGSTSRRPRRGHAARRRRCAGVAGSAVGNLSFDELAYHRWPRSSAENHSPLRQRRSTNSDVAVIEGPLLARGGHQTACRGCRFGRK